MLKKTNDARFKADVLSSSVPVLVMFSAPWAGPCSLTRPEFERRAARHGNRIEFFDFCLDDNPNVPEMFGVRSIPCFYLFVDGIPQDVVAGAISAERMDELVDQASAIHVANDQSRTADRRA